MNRFHRRVYGAMLGPFAGGGEKVAALRSCPGGWSSSLAYLRLARLIHRRFIQQAPERPLLGTDCCVVLATGCRTSVKATVIGCRSRGIRVAPWLQVHQNQNGSLGPIGPSQTARHPASLGLQCADCDELWSLRKQDDSSHRCDTRPRRQLLRGKNFLDSPRGLDSGAGQMTLPTRKPVDKLASKPSAMTQSTVLAMRELINCCKGIDFTASIETTAVKPEAMLAQRSSSSKPRLGQGAADEAIPAFAVVSRCFNGS